MKIHEHQARDLFRSFGIPMPEGRLASTPEEAMEAALALGGTVVVKAQVHAGGRGKAGGVKLAASPAEAREKARAILGMDIKGSTVRKVLLVPAVDIAREIYLGVTVDRASQRAVIMACAEGGVEIEEVARTAPEKILRMPVDPLLGLTDGQARELAFRLFQDGKQARACAGILKSLYRCFVEKDCSLAEINPLVLTKAGEVIAIDAKVNFDDNALDRHPDFEALRDMSEEDSNEIKAKKAGLSYVALDGDIGCLVNGAGLAMATLDVVKLHGGHPANFLDVGGSSDPRKVVTALEIIPSNPRVKAILFNIFGGITRCDDVAKGLLTALSRMSISLPIVVRLTGTNEAEARELLKGTRLITAETMDEAVEKAVAAARGGSMIGNAP